MGSMDLPRGEGVKPPSNVGEKKSPHDFNRSRSRDRLPNNPFRDPSPEPKDPFRDPSPEPRDLSRVPAPERNNPVHGRVVREYCGTARGIEGGAEETVGPIGSEETTRQKTFFGKLREKKNVLFGKLSDRVDTASAGMLERSAEDGKGVERGLRTLERKGKFEGVAVNILNKMNETSVARYLGEDARKQGSEYDGTSSLIPEPTELQKRVGESIHSGFVKPLSDDSGNDSDSTIRA